MKAELQFKDYHVIEAIYKYDPFFKGEEEIETPHISFKLDVNPKDIKQAVITLGIELGDSEFNSAPFYIRTKILGLFQFETMDQISEKKAIDFYKVNAVAILFPYLRSLVSDLSSKGSEAPVILPTMNIVEMINDLETKKLKNTSQKKTQKKSQKTLTKTQNKKNK